MVRATTSAPTTRFAPDQHSSWQDNAMRRAAYKAGHVRRNQTYEQDHPTSPLPGRCCRATRPTAVSLRVGTRSPVRAVAATTTVGAPPRRRGEEADAVAAEDAITNRAIGEHGLRLIERRVLNKQQAQVSRRIAMKVCLICFRNPGPA